VETDAVSRIAKVWLGESNIAHNISEIVDFGTFIARTYDSATIVSVTAFEFRNFISTCSAGSIFH